MPAVCDNRCELPVKVFIEFELHGTAVSAGNGMTRSLVISAA
jgi:hypothetical protein